MTYETERTTEPEQKKPGIWSAVAYFAGVAALVAAIWLIDDPTGSDPVPDAAPETTTTTVAEVEVTTPTFAPSEEPIADAAEVILPSVVRIENIDGPGVGSGVIYDSDGLIITAAHVVEGQDQVRVRFEDGTQTTGTVLGAVEHVDIAVVEVDRTDLPAAEFSTEKPRVGQTAIAVGSPWGLSSTVTAGIISAVDQTANCTLNGCASLVQTDAAINPGNSGGALVDRQGRVVGINVSIFSTSGANDGVGFAVPSDIALDFAESIISGDPVETGFLGVRGLQAEGDRAGAILTEITPESAAEAAGLQVEDVIVFVDGVEVQDFLDLSAQIRAHRPGDSVVLTVLRDGAELTIEVVLGERPDDQQS